MLLKRTSHSNMARAEQCPRSWKLHYQPEGGKREEEESDLQRSGKAAHELIAVYLKHLRAKTLATDYAHIDEVMNDVPPRLEALATLGPEAFQDVWEIGRKFADAWIDPLDTTAIIEEWFESKLLVDVPGTNTAVDVSIVGVIDRFSQEDESPVLTDWKTGWAVKTPSAMRQDPQTRLYALALLLNDQLRARAFPLGPRPITLRQVYPRIGMLVRQVEIEEAEFDDLTAEVTQRIRHWWTITAGPDYPPTPGHHCQFCAFKRDCPAILNGLYGYPAFVVTTPQEAEEAARKVQAMDAGRKEQMGFLRAWVDQKGPVEVDEHTLGFHASTAPTITSVAEALKLIERVPGLTPDEVLASATPKLRKALREYPLLAELDEGVLTEKTTVKFAFAKRKEVDFEPPG